MLEMVAFGWNVMGAWGIGVGVWLVWYPAWMVAVLLSISRPAQRGGVEGVAGTTSEKGVDGSE
jgi:hypothetical protein